MSCIQSVVKITFCAFQDEDTSGLVAGARGPGVMQVGVKLIF
jgi:hypothetical protein